MVDLISMLVDFVISLGSAGQRRYLGGPTFDLTYVSGHPDVHLPDDKGRLTIARERLKYTTGRSDDLVFVIPMDLVARVRPLDPDMVELHLDAADGSWSDIYFRGRKRKEIKRFLAALTPRLESASASD